MWECSNDHCFRGSNPTESIIITVLGPRTGDRRIPHRGNTNHPLVPVRVIRVKLRGESRLRDAYYWDRRGVTTTPDVGNRKFIVIQ